MIQNDFYQVPIGSNSTGDIWKGLPTFGLIKSKTCGGIVITPSCDLENNKVETITYLPIIPISAYFASRAFYDEIRTVLLNSFENLEFDLNEYSFNKNVLPSLFVVNQLQDQLQKHTVNKQKQQFKDKCIVGLEIVESIINPKTIHIHLAKYRALFGDKRFNAILDKIITNSFSNDLHFLPKDGDDEWSALNEHSIALFRYPITVPIEVFNLANDVNIVNWNESLKSLIVLFPIGAQFESQKPLRSNRLKNEHLSDLLTRFVSLYNRIGSPDIRSESISIIRSEIV